MILGNPNYSENKLWNPSITSDELSLYFGGEILGATEQLLVATRSSASSDFGYAQVVPAPVQDTAEGTPHVLPDGLTLYFYSTRAGGAGGRDLYVATRGSVSDSFSSVQALSELNTAGDEHLPWVSTDKLTIYFTRLADGQTDANIWRATRTDPASPFDAPQLVAELNSASEEERVTLTADQRAVIFGSRRAGGTMQLYQAVRAATTEPFGSPFAITEFTSATSDANPALSPDGKTLYFVSTRNGANPQIWRSTRTCP